MTSTISSGSWENWAAGSAAGDSEAEEDVPAGMTLEQAGQQFVDLLIDMKLAGRINATQACIISFWAAKAGARGPCSELGKRPGLQSGKYSMSFDKFTQLGPASMDLYQLPIARRLKMDLGRR